MTNLNELKVEEVRTIAKEMNIAGAWKMKKADLISAIEAKQIVEVQHEEDCSVVNKVTYQEFIYINGLVSPFFLLEAPKQEVVKPVKPGKELLITVTTNDGRVLTGSRWVDFEEELKVKGTAIWKFYKNKGSKAINELLATVTKEKI